MNQMTLLVLNGPGPDLAAAREACAARCEQLALGLDFRQAKSAAELLQWIAKDADEVAGLLLNPAGVDSEQDAEQLCAAIAALEVPVIEVHLDNIFAGNTAGTEPLRAAEVDLGLVCGLGVNGYVLGINSIVRTLQAR